MCVCVCVASTCPQSNLTTSQLQNSADFSLKDELSPLFGPRDDVQDHHGVMRVMSMQFVLCKLVLINFVATCFPLPFPLLEVLLLLCTIGRTVFCERFIAISWINECHGSGQHRHTNTTHLNLRQKENASVTWCMCHTDKLASDLHVL